MKKNPKYPIFQITQKYFCDLLFLEYYCNILYSKKNRFFAALPFFVEYSIFIDLVDFYIPINRPWNIPLNISYSKKSKSRDVFVGGGNA